MWLGRMKPSFVTHTSKTKAKKMLDTLLERIQDGNVQVVVKGDGKERKRRSDDSWGKI